MKKIKVIGVCFALLLGILVNNSNPIFADSSNNQEYYISTVVDYKEGEPFKVIHINEKKSIADIGLPDKINVLLDNSAEITEIPITWECTDYLDESQLQDKYIFKPTFEDSYKIDEEMKNKIYIEVYFQEMQDEPQTNATKTIEQQKPQVLSTSSPTIPVGTNQTYISLSDYFQKVTDTQIGDLTIVYMSDVDEDLTYSNIPVVVPTDMGITSLKITANSPVTVNMSLCCNGISLQLDKNVTVNDSIYAGSYNTDLGNASHILDTTLNIYGKVNSVYGGSYSVDKETHTYMNSTLNLYGNVTSIISGSGFVDLQNGQSVTHTGNVIIHMMSSFGDEDGWDTPAVYGGGYFNRGTGSHILNGNVTIDIQASQFDEVDEYYIIGFVYGGGCAAGSGSESSVKGNISITQNRYTDATCGGGRVMKNGGIANVEGDIHISVQKMKSPTWTHGVYGGGGFTDSYVMNAITNVKGDIDIDIGNNVEIEADVIGGGYANAEGSQCNVEGNINIHVGSYSKIHTAYGYGDGQFTGGGFAGEYDTIANVTGNITSTIDDNVKIYGFYRGGGNAAYYVAEAQVGGKITNKIADQVSIQGDGQFIGGGDTQGEEETNVSVTGGIQNEVGDSFQVKYFIAGNRSTSAVIDSAYLNSGTIQTKVGNSLHVESSFYGGHNADGINSKANITGEIDLVIGDNAQIGQFLRVANYAGKNGITANITGDVTVQLGHDFECKYILIGASSKNVQGSKINIGGDVSATIKSIKYVQNGYVVLGGYNNGTAQANIAGQASLNILGRSDNDRTSILYIYPHSWSSGNAVANIQKGVNLQLEDTYKTDIHTLEQNASSVKNGMNIYLGGEVQLANGIVSHFTDDTIVGDVNIHVGNGTKQTEVTSSVIESHDESQNTNLHIYKNAKMTLTGNSQSDMLKFLTNLTIDQNGILQLEQSVISPILGDFVGNGQLIMPATAQISSQTGTFTGNLLVQIKDPLQLDQTLFIFDKNSSGKMTLENEGYRLKKEENSFNTSWIVKKDISDVTVNIKNGKGTVNPEGTFTPELNQIIEIVPEYGYKLSDVLVDGISAMQDIKIKENRIYQYKLTSLPIVSIEVIFDKMNAADMSSTIQKLTPLDEDAIIDAKIDYESLDQHQQESIHHEDIYKLHELLLNLSNIEVIVEGDKNQSSVEILQKDYPLLLTELTKDDVMKLKKKTLSHIQIYISTKEVYEKEIDEEGLKNIYAQLGEYRIAQFFDIQITKNCYLKQQIISSTPISTLDYPLTCYFSVENLHLQFNQCQFDVLRTHRMNGNYETVSLQGQLNKDKISVSTNQFSIYTLIYKNIDNDTQKPDEKPSIKPEIHPEQDENQISSDNNKPQETIKTDDSLMIIPMVVGIMLSLTVIYVLKRKRL